MRYGKHEIKITEAKKKDPQFISNILCTSDMKGCA